MSESQVQAAAALRRLGHALVAHDAPADQLQALAALADDWAARLESQPRRRRPDSDLRDDTRRGPPPDGDVVEHYDRCPVSGPANPFSFGLVARRTGDAVACRVVLGAGGEGAPGRAHGGVVAALFDDATAFLTKLIAQPSMAAELSVRFRRGMPVGVPVDIDAHIARREGRRLYTEATARYAGEVIAEATCLKIALRE